MKTYIPRIDPAAASRYELLGRLDRGGMADVYRAYDNWHDRVVAYKKAVEPNEVQAAAMAREARALARLRHPRIGALLDVDCRGPVPALVLEYIPGWSVESLVREGGFQSADFSEVAGQALEALAFIHDAGWVHGDIKPGNLMMMRGGDGCWQVKWIDFGLSTPAGEAAVGGPGPSRDDLGSIYFMAPERFDGHPASQAADLYALGAVLYYLLSGMYPVDGASEIEVMAGHILGHIEPLECAGEVPAGIRDLVMALLRTDPAERPTAAEALAMLRQPAPLAPLGRA
jgi:eukaryotic-like serine/threonine-protein kinase